MADAVACKTIIVGDGAIGKTCLLSRITNNSIDWGDDDSVPYEPTTFNNFNLTWEQEGDEGLEALELELWDTAGQEGFEQLRTLSYPGTDVYLIGFSCASMISLNNIEHKWLPEIKRCREESGDVDEPWIILVGTKMDIRDGVTEEREREIAKMINACALIDTSAKESDRAASGVDTLEALIMTLGFRKAAGESRPDWGELEAGDEEEEAGGLRQSTGNVKDIGSVEPKEVDHGVKGPDNVPIKECPPHPKPAKKDEDPSCNCVIA